jgi:hypothetical protein
MSGVNTPYLDLGEWFSGASFRLLSCVLGMWRATLAWHVEVDLYWIYSYPLGRAQILIHHPEHAHRRFQVNNEE